MKEIWKTAVGFDKYDVSSKGNVRKKSSQRILKQRLQNKKMLVSIRNSKGQRTSTDVGRLVLNAFKQYKPSTKYTAKHIDGNPMNNNVNNLEWEGRFKRTGKVIVLVKGDEKHQFRTFKNAAKFLNISTEQASFVSVEHAARKRGYRVWVRDDISNEVNKSIVEYETVRDKKYTSSPEVKQQIREKVDEFVRYCEKHYSTYSQIEGKGVIKNIDESDPVVIEFRTFMLEHNL